MSEKGYIFAQKFTDDNVFDHLQKVYKQVLEKEDK